MTPPFLSAFWKQNHKAEEVLLGNPSSRSFLSPSTFSFAFQTIKFCPPHFYPCICVCVCVLVCAFTMAYMWRAEGNLWCWSSLPSCLKLSVFLLPQWMLGPQDSRRSPPWASISPWELCIWFYLWSLEFKLRSSHLCGKFLSHLTIFPGPPLVFQMRCCT